MARSKKSSKAAEKAAMDLIKAIISLVISVFSGLFNSLSLLFSRGSSEIRLPGGNDYTYEIVGESHYQDSLMRICGGRSEEAAQKFVEARLVLDDKNPHDNKAVRVDIDGNVVGYLSKQNARKYRAYLKKIGRGDVVGVCQAVVVGGWDRGKGDVGNFGVKLDLSVP